MERSWSGQRWHARGVDQIRFPPAHLWPPHSRMQCCLGRCPASTPSSLRLLLEACHTATHGRKTMSGILKLCSLLTPQHRTALQFVSIACLKA